MTYRLTRADADLLDEALSTGALSSDDLRAAQLIAPDLVQLEPRWRPSAHHRNRATRAIRTAREKTREGAAIYDLVDYPDAGVVCRVILQAAHSEQAWAWESSMTGDPYDDAGHLDKAAELRRLARLIESHHDEYPTEGQVIAHLARELEIAREEYGADASRAQRLATTLRELLDEVEPVAAESLASGEREFLLTHAGMSEEDLSEQDRAATRLEIARDRFALDAAALEGALSTSEVAALLGRAEAIVQRSRLSGDLYAPNPGDPAGLRFPCWQFTSAGGVVPGLSRIIPAFSRDTHPLVVARFMTQAHEDLDGTSPVEWLAGDGPVDPIVDLVEDLGHV